MIFGLNLFCEIFFVHIDFIGNKHKWNITAGQLFFLPIIPIGFYWKNFIHWPALWRAILQFPFTGRKTTGESGYCNSKNGEAF